MARSLRSLCTALEQILFQDPGNRGIAPICVAGELFTASRALRDLKAKGGSLCILSGFPVPPNFVPETDGPAGAVALVRAANALGCKGIVVTDGRCEKVFRAALDEGEVGSHELIVLPSEGSDELPHGILSRIFGEENCRVVVAIERVGKNAEGRRLSMGGVDVTSVTSNVDAFFEALIDGKKAGQDYIRIGIGDGGNELGMGKVRQIVEDQVNNGKAIAAVESCEALLTCGVSNWGGYALEAISLLLSKEMNGQEAAKAFLQNFKEREMRLHRATLDVGCIDGIAKAASMSVDGLALETHFAIAKSIAETLKEAGVCGGE